MIVSWHKAQGMFVFCWGVFGNLLWIISSYYIGRIECENFSKDRFRICSRTLSKVNSSKLFSTIPSKEGEFQTRNRNQRWSLQYTPITCTIRRWQTWKKTHFARNGLVMKQGPFTEVEWSYICFWVCYEKLPNTGKAVTTECYSTSSLEKLPSFAKK